MLARIVKQSAHFKQRSLLRLFSSEASSSTSDRLHSTDIAFKPSSDGWGATKKFSKNHERIFGKKGKEKGFTKDGVTKLTFKTRQ
jgi:hypothetical protein